MAMHGHESCMSSDDADEAGQSMRSFMGPQAVDQAIRQAISTCWMILPDDKKTVENVEVEIRRIIDRALANLKEDARSFGIKPVRRGATRKKRQKE